MSVLIRGMEMPTSCIKCKLCVSYKCVPTGEIRWSDEFDYDSKRFENCPLVPVPPHGRLIDADEIVRYKERLVIDADKINPKIRYVVDTKYIDDAPIIIPAEEGE